LTAFHFQVLLGWIVIDEIFAQNGEVAEGLDKLEIASTELL
jgi:hypothetical protein